MSVPSLNRVQFVRCKGCKRCIPIAIEPSNQLGRKVKRGERGIRILAPIIGVKRKPEAKAEKKIIKQNRPVLVGFRAAYVFDVSQTEGAELPEFRRVTGEVGENRDRLLSFLEKQG